MSTQPSPDRPFSELSPAMDRTPAGEPPDAHGRKPAPRHWFSLILVVILAIAVAVPPLFNMQRYQQRIAANIGRSLGRPVHFSHISLRLVPRPGFDLDDFTVDEAPGFGYEPILHSSSVRASVRLLSLLRGRLEIARIALDEPSLNLVRNADGKWNFASAITQASKTPVSPTGQAVPGRTLRFPYIEATSARINFKFGDEKQPFSFLDGDLSLWLENPEEWQLRFTAQPVRTDIDLFASNTGKVRVQGSVKRASVLGEIPVDLRTDWTHVPLGQIGRLFGGEDSGWEGEVNLRSHLTGTPAALLVHSSLQLDDLHRVEFQPEHTLSYSAECQGTYRKILEQMDGLSCVVPIGDGHLQIDGMAHSPMQPGPTQLVIGLNRIPASALLNFLKITRQGLGKDVAIDGNLNGKLTMSLGQPHSTLSGSVATEQLTMAGPSLAQPLVIAGVKLSAIDGGSLAGASATKGRRSRTPAAISPGNPPSLLLAPVKIDFGATAPLLVDGRFDRRGFFLHFGGRAELARLLPAIHSIGMNVPGLQSLQPTGEAILDAQLRGPWLLPVSEYGPASEAGNRTAVSAPTGSITLHDARLQTNYLAAPLIIKSAEAALLGTESGDNPGGYSQIAWSGIVAQYGPVHFTGSFRASLPCIANDGDTTAAGCTRQFDITVPSLDFAALAAGLAGSDPLMQNFLHRIERNDAGPDWPAMHGTVRAATATLGTLNLTEAIATLDVKGARCRIESLDAKTLDGALHLSGSLDAGPAPIYHLDAQLNQAAVPAMAQIFHQTWGTGTMNIAAHLTLKGLAKADLLSSAQGAFHFDWSHGGLRLPASVRRSPFAHFEQWTADGQIRDQGFTLEQSLLTAADEARAVQGTIGFDTQLDLKATAAPGGTGVAAPATASETEADDQASTLTGTLAVPEVPTNSPLL